MQAIRPRHVTILEQAENFKRHSRSCSYVINDENALSMAAEPLDNGS